MDKIFCFLLLFVGLLSIFDVITDDKKYDRPEKQSHEDLDQFREFDERPEFKYLEESQSIDHSENMDKSEIIEDDPEEFKIRNPSQSEPFRALKTSMNMPPIRFAFW